MTKDENPALKTSVTVVPPKERGIKRRRMRQWVLRLSLALTILGPFLFMAAAIGYKIGIFDLGFSLGTLTRNLGPKILMLGLLVGAVALIMALVFKPRKGLIIGLVGILIPLIGLGSLMNVRNTAQSLPFIHDITTDTQDVPKFGPEIMAERTKVKGVNTTDYSGKMAQTKDAKGHAKEALVSVLQTKGYPDIRSIVVSGSRDAVFGQAEQAAKDMGWDIKATDTDAGTIEATDTTFWYGFKDDIIIRLRNSEGGGTLIDVRSISRVGGSDLGKNADRIRSFLDKMKEA